MTFSETYGKLLDLTQPIGNLLKMTNDTELKKVKTTIYMTKEDDDLLNEVFIKRLRQRKKTDRSALLCEGIKLLYEKECKVNEEQPKVGE